MRVSKVCAGLLLAGSVIVTGCKSADTPQPSPSPTTSATAAPSTAPVEAATTGPAVAVTAPPVAPPVSVAPPPTTVAPATAPTTPPPPVVAKPAFAATHVVSKDQPYFNAVPASPTAAPDGTFKAGTKVLVFSFSGSYAKVTAEDGTTAYTATEGIDPISKK